MTNKPVHRPGWKGIFISIEGPEGAGKTTQAELLKQRLESLGLEVYLTREPGGTAVGEEIRKILLNPRFGEMTVRCEVLLYSAARAQLVHQLVVPHLNRGRIVISDRFLDSSIVYQGLAGGEDPREIARINDWSTGQVRPDVTLLLDVRAEKGLERLRSPAASSEKEGEAGRDRIEKRDLDFHEKVRRGFLELAAGEEERFYVVDAEQEPGEVHARVWARVWKALLDRQMVVQP